MGLFAFDKPLALFRSAFALYPAWPRRDVTSFVLCLFYVLWANRVYDPGVRNLAR